MKRASISFLLLIPLVVSCHHEPARLELGEIALPPLSDECPRAATEKFGRPIMREIRKDLFLGLSVAEDHGPEHNPFPVYVWIQNRSDEAQSISSCTDVDWFKMYGFNVYDSDGHRIPSRWDQDDSATGCSQEMTCESTAEALILPHTCRPPERKEGYDLAYVYALPPGQYSLRLANVSECKTDPKTGILRMQDRWTPRAQAAPFLSIRVDPR